MKSPIFLAQQGISNPVVSGLQGKDQADAPGLFGTWLGSIIAIFMIAGAIWALIQMMRGALQWVASGGDQEKLQHAQGMIRDGVIGLVILFSIWALYLLILSWLGVGTLSPDGSFQFKFPTLFGDTGGGGTCSASSCGSCTTEAACNAVTGTGCGWAPAGDPNGSCS